MPSTHRDLVAWQRAMDLAEAIHRAVAGFPKHELYALTAQMRSAAVSIPSNIAEGHGRSSPKEFAHFLAIGRGSLRELETQIELAKRFGYLTPDQTTALAEHTNGTGKVLTGLLASLRACAQD